LIEELKENFPKVTIHDQLGDIGCKVVGYGLFYFWIKDNGIPLFALLSIK
jgi:hypothetical protein